MAAKKTVKRSTSRTSKLKKGKVTKMKMAQSVLFGTQKARIITSVIGVLIFAFVGMHLLRLSYAGSPSSPTATSSCGARVEGYTYQVPFGQAIWNQPVCGLPKHPLSADYANRFLEWSHVNDGSPSADANNGYVSVNPGYPKKDQLDPLAGLFTREVYYASDATTETRIQTRVYDSNLDGDNLSYSDIKRRLPDNKIPWNPKWKTGKGGDNEIVILDNRPGPTQGRIYGVSGYKKDAEAVLQGCLIAERLCTYTTSVGRDMNGNYIDYRTYQGYLKERGVGLSYYATLVTPEEVAAGEIRHAVGISIPNTSYGTICTKDQLGTSAEGKTCGTAVAPATKFEHGNAKTAPGISEKYKSLYTLDKTIPEGMIFAIDVTDQQIEDWINSRTDLKKNPRRAQTARIFARAIKDYGMLIADTNGSRASVQTVGGVNPDSAAQWTSLGLGDDEKNNLLNGLINKDNLYVVNPPVATCKDGSKSQYYCEWTSIAYENTQTSVTPPVDPEAATPKDPNNGKPDTPPSDNNNSNNNNNNGSSSSSSGSNDETGNNNNGTTRDTKKPTVPSSLGRELVFDVLQFRYNLKLTWRPSTDNVGVQDYIVSRNGIEIGTTKNTTFTDNKIMAGISYDYSVAARDAAGNVSNGYAKTSAKGSCFFIWCALE